MTMTMTMTKTTTIDNNKDDPIKDNHNKCYQYMNSLWVPSPKFWMDSDDDDNDNDDDDDDDKKNNNNDDDKKQLW